MAALSAVVKGCLLGFALYCVYVMLSSSDQNSMQTTLTDNSKAKLLQKKQSWPAAATSGVDRQGENRAADKAGVGILADGAGGDRGFRDDKVTAAASSAATSGGETGLEKDALKKLRELKKEKKRLREEEGASDPLADVPTDRATGGYASSKVESANKKLEKEIRIMQCAMMREKHHVVPGVSWGSLDTEGQRKWTRMRCDSAPTEHPMVPSEHDPAAVAAAPDDAAAAAAAPAALPPDAPSFLPPWMHLPAALQHNSHRVPTQQQSQGSGVGLPVVSDEKTIWCTNAREKYKVRPMKSWGSLPADMIESWKKRSCDLVFTSARMARREVTTCPAQLGDVLGRKAQHAHDARATQFRLVAIMAATTTRKVHNPSPNNLALFTYLLPSLIRSLDCGFIYEYVLGYDQGDPFYDSEAGSAAVKEWFRANVQDPMEARGVSITLRLVRVNNTLRKPGPVFIAMARAAYAAGADYLYRINDDTELVEHWPSIFVSALQATPFPHGVVGPTCHQGNRKILTHDFVHRTHMEIFDMNYYPTELTDWWMDDWISLVYGRDRTYKARGVTVVHHTGAHGQRYEVDRAHEKLLTVLVDSGRKKIRQHMLSKGVPEAQLREFDRDRFDREFVHGDVPGGGGRSHTRDV